MSQLQSQTAFWCILNQKTIWVKIEYLFLLWHNKCLLKKCLVQILLGPKNDRSKKFWTKKKFGGKKSRFQKFEVKRVLRQKLLGLKNFGSYDISWFEMT